METTVTCANTTGHASSQGFLATFFRASLSGSTLLSSRVHSDPPPAPATLPGDFRHRESRLRCRFRPPQRPRRRDEPPRPSQPLQIGVCARHRATQRPVTVSLLMRLAVTLDSLSPPAQLVPPGPLAQPPSHALARPGPRPASLDSPSPPAQLVSSPRQADRGLQKFARAFARSLATGFANASSKSLLSPGSDGQSCPGPSKSSLLCYRCQDFGARGRRQGRGGEGSPLAIIALPARDPREG